MPIDANPRAGKERRRYPRIKTQVSIELRIAPDSPPLRASSAEISLGGCYIESMFTLAVGTKVSMILWLNEQPVHTNAVVATRHPQFGNGFEFVEMAEENRGRLSQFLANLSTETTG